ncbi:MAG: hybrid sensor histidine kinase/response regulator, partial [Proteobacteria bacterium]
MDIKFTQRLSYKQARLTVLVGFILGALLSVIQIGIDYAIVDQTIDRQMRSLLEISHNPASRIAYNIDAELAKELTLGLLQSESITGARLTDNNGNVLASVQRPRLESSYRFISDILFNAQRQYEDPLFLSHMPDDRLGTLQLTVDTFAIGNRFLRRAEITLASGFLRTALLTALLLGFFYVMLTKPLNRVIRALSNSDPHQPKPARLDYPPGHEHDEIGVLVKVANQQFISMATEIQQRRSAENRLTE